MFCQNCGTKNPDSAKFCRNCGNPTNNFSRSTPAHDHHKEENKKSPWGHYLTVFKKYAMFSGRAQRAEYWYFTLANLFVYILLCLLLPLPAIYHPYSAELTLSGGFFTMESSPLGPLWAFFSGLAQISYILFGVYSLSALVPGLAVSIRRLHDVGKSGAMILINLIPFVGPIWFLILILTDSDPDNNRYGPNPKY